MDVSNICRILNCVGQANIFDPLHLNKFLTQERYSGITPTTIHSRFKSFSRFIDCLNSIEYNSLPTSNKLSKLSFMLHDTEKSLLRMRKARISTVMAMNRQNIDHRNEVLQK